MIDASLQNTYTVDRLLGRGVFENDLELGEVGGELAQVLQEVFLRIENRDILQIIQKVVGIRDMWQPVYDPYLFIVTRNFTMKVQHHTFLFQSLENGVVRLVRLDA